MLNRNSRNSEITTAASTMVAPRRAVVRWGCLRVMVGASLGVRGRGSHSTGSPVVTVTGRSRMLYQSTVAVRLVPLGMTKLDSSQRTLSNGRVTVMVNRSSWVAWVGSVQLELVMLTYFRS